MKFKIIILFLLINVSINSVYAKSYKGYLKINENYSYYSIYQEKEWGERIYLNLEKAFNFSSKNLLELETNLGHKGKYSAEELLAKFNYNFTDNIFFNCSNECLFSQYYKKDQQGNNEIDEKANFAFNFIFLDAFTLKLGHDFKYNKFKTPNSFNYDYNSSQIKTNLDYDISFDTSIGIGFNYLIFKMLSPVEQLSQEDYDLYDLYEEEPNKQTTIPKKSEDYEEYDMVLIFSKTFNTEINFNLEHEMKTRNYYYSLDKNKLWQQNTLLNIGFPLFSNLKANLKGEIEKEDYKIQDEYNADYALFKIEPGIEYNFDNFIFKISYVREKKDEAIHINETEPTYSYLKTKIQPSLQYESKIFSWEGMIDLEKHKCPFGENDFNKKYLGNTISSDFSWRLNSLWKFCLWTSYTYLWYSTDSIEETNFLTTAKIQYSF